MSAPVAAPLTVHDAVEPGSRRAASWPAMPPAIAPPNAMARTLGDRPEQDVAPGHRRHHQVASVACFQRDRPSVTAAAEAEGDGRDGEQPDQRGAAIANRIELRTGDRIVTHEIAQPHHGEPADDGGEVHAVGDLEPLQLAEPAAAPGSPKVANRR